MTIYDIARLANTSPAAVSRVINNKPGVSQKNREKIRAIIEENHFSIRRGRRSSDPSASDPSASSGSTLNRMTSTKGTVAILIDDPVSEYQSLGATMFQTELFNIGYGTVTRCTDKDHDLNFILSGLISENLSAVVMMGYSYTNQRLVTEAITQYIPSVPVILVRQTTNFGLPNVYCVGINDRKGISDCVNALVSRGRSHLALIMDRQLGEKSAIRYFFEVALSQFENTSYYSYDDVEYTVAGGEEVAERIVRNHPETDGILCVRDPVAIGLVYGLQKNGYRIPEDISIIGKDNSKLCEACNPPLTSLDSLLMDSFRVSIHLLQDVLEHKISTHGILLAADIIHRGTL